jgi:peroxiredoxin family protein
MATILAQKEKAEPVQAAQNKLCIILSKGSLDMAYPAFMLATTAATMGSEVHVFFTFWGLDVVNRKKVGSLKISPVGNPGMPMPNILGMLPGMTAMATRMMKGKIQKIKMATIPEMVQTAKDLGVKLHACSTTMELQGMTKDNLIAEIDDVVGAASFLKMSEGAQTLFI